LRAPRARPRQLEFDHKVQRHPVGDGFAQLRAEHDAEIRAQRQAFLRGGESRIDHFDVVGARAERRCASQREKELRQNGAGSNVGVPGLTAPIARPQGG
jgi:hypothetical protein